MRVAFITTRFYPIAGGAGTISKILADFLCKNLDIDIITEKEICTGYFNRMNEYNVRRLKTFYKERFLKHVFFSLKSCIISNNYDVVHFHDVTSSFFAFLCLKKKILKYGGDIIYEYLMLAKPWLKLTDVIEAWDYNIFTILLKNIVAFYMKNFDVVYTNSEYGKRCLKKMGVKASVIRNGVNINEFKPVDKKKMDKLKDIHGFKNKKIFFISSRFVPWKGIDIALKAFVEANIKNSLFLIAGYGPFINRLERICYRKKNIIFLGNLSKEKNRKYLLMSDVFVHIPYMDWCPNSLLEAMACGKNVITTTYGGLKEIVNRKNAFIVENLNIKTVASIFKDSLSENKGCYARKTIEKKFDIKIMLKRVRDLYNKV